MNPEKLKALTFIVVGCIGATALGITVWQTSSPTRPTLDIAMHTTTATSPAPAGFKTPGGDPSSGEEQDLNNQVLAAVDTADPYLPPNAYVRPQTRDNAPTSISGQSTVPNVANLGPQDSITATPPTSTSRTERPETTPSSDEPGPTNSPEAEPSVPAPSTPLEPPAPVVTPPMVTDEPDDADETDETDSPTTPVSPALPTEPTDTTDPDAPSSTPQPDTPETDEPDATLEPTPTDFVDEPTAPLNPNTPAGTVVPEQSPSDTMAD